MSIWKNLYSKSIGKGIIMVRTLWQFRHRKETSFHGYSKIETFLLAIHSKLKAFHWLLVIRKWKLILNLFYHVIARKITDCCLCTCWRCYAQFKKRRTPFENMCPCLENVVFPNPVSRFPLPLEYTLIQCFHSRQILNTNVPTFYNSISSNS